jgi:hypothetical protein
MQVGFYQQDRPLPCSARVVARLIAMIDLPSSAGRIALLTDSRSVGADHLRLLRMWLLELRQLAKLQSIVITSPLAWDRVAPFPPVRFGAQVTHLEAR